MRAALFVLTVGLALLPANTRANAPPKGNRPVPFEDGRDTDAEALKKEIEALRRNVGAVGKKDEKPETVVVTSPMTRDVAVTQRYAGQIRAHRYIEIRALATGVITEVPVKEGQAVKKDDVLFKVSPALYQAKLDAELAEVKIAQLEFDHTKKLAAGDKPVVSQQEAALAEAKLARAKARAKLAEVELNFTIVRAPFDGLVGRLREREGSLVKKGDPLTPLSDNSVLWVYFNVSEARYLEYEARPGKGPDRSRLELPDSRIELVLADGSTFNQDAGNVVTVEHEAGDVFVIKKGLDVNDRIVLDGVRRVRNGDKVEPVFQKPEEVIGSPKTGREK
ncbi:MAG: efflux RND transporter periplasmic adaptor subunit [Planctomycetes bacterium]|nr:efflux RND transporter periplasmic adaptor subunit [Planctomycetota bacterium]